MHELSIAMSILDAAEEEAGKHGGGRVSAIYIRVGALSGVAPDALQNAYELAREATPLSDCRLVIEETPGPDLLVSALEFAA
jgi:hydrogenase nickel incorporation protein HypA/HybF